MHDATAKRVAGERRRRQAERLAPVPEHRTAAVGIEQDDGAAIGRVQSNRAAQVDSAFLQGSLDHRALLVRAEHADVAARQTEPGARGDDSRGLPAAQRDAFDNSSLARIDGGGDIDGQRHHLVDGIRPHADHVVNALQRCRPQGRMIDWTISRTRARDDASCSPGVSFNPSSRRCSADRRNTKA